MKRATSILVPFVVAKAATAAATTTTTTTATATTHIRDALGGSVARGKGDEPNTGGSHFAQITRSRELNEARGVSGRSVRLGRFRLCLCHVELTPSQPLAPSRLTLRPLNVIYYISGGI